MTWQKKVQALGSSEDESLTIAAQGQEVAVVEEFVYLGSLIHSTVHIARSGDSLSFVLCIVCEKLTTCSFCRWFFESVGSAAQIASWSGSSKC